MLASFGVYEGHSTWGILLDPLSPSWNKALVFSQQPTIKPQNLNLIFLSRKKSNGKSKKNHNLDFFPSLVQSSLFILFPRLVYQAFVLHFLSLNPKEANRPYNIVLQGFIYLVLG
jgi:hypothetical protein